MLEEACHQHHHPTRQKHTLVSLHSVINMLWLEQCHKKEEYLVEALGLS